MLKKTLTLVVIIAMALPGLMAIMPATQGLPSMPDAGRNLLAGEEGAGASFSSPTKLHLVVADFVPLACSSSSSSGPPCPAGSIGWRRWAATSCPTFPTTATSPS